VFRQAVELYLEREQRPASEQVRAFIRAAELGLSESTVKRRATTVLSWADWVISLSKRQ
jgi:hypothetical protein